MQNWRLDDLISSQSNDTKLTKALSLVQPRRTTGSLAAYDGFDFAELYRFMQIFHQNINEIITGVEQFSGEMLAPKKERVSLPDNIYELLVKYYNESYDHWDFVSITELAYGDLSANNRSIVVLPNVNQFGRVRIATEIFGSKFAPRYQRSSQILAKFIQDDETIDTYPGQVQFYFEHTIKLPTGTKTHRLAFVKWYLFASDDRTRFHCRIDSQDDKSCNVELWKYDFFEPSRDSIVPIHNIYSQFLSSKFVLNNRTRNPPTYMAVIPINRQFHL